MYFLNELELLDYVYNEAGNKPFSYDYYSVPYWRNESWEYLFSWYGAKKYGYTPQKDRTQVFYVFIEPEEKLNYQKDQWYKGLEENSEFIDKKISGKLTAEKRMKK